jgi:hypothetical protein
MGIFNLSAMYHLEKSELKHFLTPEMNPTESETVKYFI